MQVDPSVSLRMLRAGYRSAWETSNRILEAIGDPDAQVTRDGKTHFGDPYQLGGCPKGSVSRWPGTPGGAQASDAP